MKENHNSLNSCNSSIKTNELHELHEFYLAAGEMEFMLLPLNNQIVEME